MSRVLPALFVVLWSSGFVGARAVLPYSEPFTFLALRFGLTALVLLPVVLARRAPVPHGGSFFHVVVAGLMVHAWYLGGVFFAVDRGMPAGLIALIAGLQPLLTAALALPLLGERPSRRQWGGLGLGLIGVIMVLGEKLAPQGDTLFSGFGLPALGGGLLALVGLTVGTLYQKRFCQGVDLGMASFLQFTVSTMALLPLAFLLETRTIAWTGEFIAGLVWLVLGLSVGAVFLLLLLIKRGGASQVASLFYLVPPVTALMAWALYDEPLGPLALAGMAVAGTGVALAARR
ncbi:DMT family transporter [Pararhodospirillum photometricum]|nr:DMT family transporter [Pararhodospirillum photometricum]